MPEHRPLDYETPQPKGFRLPADWRRRAAFALAAGVLVFAITLEAARRAQSDLLLLYAGTPRTRVMAEGLQGELDAYVQETGQIPPKLADIPFQGSTKWPLNDEWGTPFQLIIKGGKATVFSYGRDRAPGGEGWDADIYADHREGPIKLTPMQYLQAAPLARVLILCLLTACLTAAATFGPMRPQNGPKGIAAMLLSAAVTGIVAVLIASVMAAFEVTSGH